MEDKTKFKQTEIGRIPEDWEVVRFGDYIELRHGHQFRHYDFVENGIKVFKITQIREDGGIDVSDCSYVDESRIKEFKDIVIGKGDILMALTGATIGKIAKVREDLGIILQNYRVGRFLPLNYKKVSKDFLYYFLCSEAFFKTNACTNHSICTTKYRQGRTQQHLFSYARTI
jgi:type I restriction enzyme S subunit